MCIYILNSLIANNMILLYVYYMLLLKTFKIIEDSRKKTQSFHYEKSIKVPIVAHNLFKVRTLMF